MVSFGLAQPEQRTIKKSPSRPFISGKSQDQTDGRTWMVADRATTNKVKEAPQIHDKLRIEIDMKRKEFAREIEAK